MNYRQLGKTGIRVSEIGLGTWEMSGDVWGKKDDAVSLQALEVGLNAGANFIDTAAGYGSGHAEEVVGTVLARRSVKRDQVVISTKVKPECGQFAPPPEREIRDFYKPEWIRAECEASLKRLKTDYVDILFLHTWSRSWGHEIGWYDELTRLKKTGKIRSFGISIPDEGITDANVQVALGLVDVIQCVFNAFQQEPLYSLLPLASKYDVGVVARSPFSSGVIVQDWNPEMKFPEGDWRGSWPLDVKPGWLEDQVAMAEKVKPVLDDGGVGATKAALAFILASPEVSSVIPGSANPQHVAENMSASGSALPSATLRQVRQLWLDRQIHGTYNGSI
jgi:aryl-alcohol dehydrogenase-like predicted oxidoreductase